MKRFHRPAYISLLLLLQLGGYVLLLRWFPLVPYFNQFPQLDVRAFTPSLAAGLAYGALLISLFVGLIISYRLSRTEPGLQRLGFIVAAAALYGGVLLATYPINATDVYRYVIRGRVSAVYGENPFATPPAAFAEDPFLPLAGEWAGETSPYGPLWELTATAVTHFTQDNLLWGLLAFKFIGWASHLAITVLMWQLLANRSPAQRAGLTLLWAWNPALLLTLVVNAHNDGWMLFWLLLGYAALRRQRPGVGFWLMVLAPLTKPIGLLALPFFFVAAWRAQPRPAAKWRFAGTAVLGAGVLGLVAFLPFGSPLDLATRLVREASLNPGFSPATLILLIDRRLGGALPFAAVGNAARILFALLALWLLWRTWHGRSLLRATADIFGGYILQALSFRLWYATWLFPWTLLETEAEGNGRLHFRPYAALAFLLTTQLSVLIYGHLRVYLFGGDQLWAHAVGVPFTFGLPLLLAWRRPRL